MMSKILQNYWVMNSAGILLGTQDNEENED